MSDLKTLADDLLEVLDKLQKSVKEGKSKLQPQVAGELDTAIRRLCAAVKSDKGIDGGQITPKSGSFT